MVLHTYLLEPLKNLPKTLDQRDRFEQCFLQADSALNKLHLLLSLPQKATAQKL